MQFDERNVESIKSLIREWEAKKKELTEEYEKSLSEIEESIMKFKIHLADVILSYDDEGDKPSGTVFVGVKFKKNSEKIYNYLWCGEEIKVGDMVQVENNWNGEMQEVEVVRVFEGSSVYDEDYKCAYPIEC